MEGGWWTDGRGREEGSLGIGMEAERGWEKEGKKGLEGGRKGMKERGRDRGRVREGMKGKGGGDGEREEKGRTKRSEGEGSKEGEGMDRRREEGNANMCNVQQLRREQGARWPGLCGHADMCGSAAYD